MRLLILLSAVYFVHAAPATPTCPEGTVKDKTSKLCYYFGTEQLTFLAAEKHCLQRGGQLSSITSAQQNAFIAAEAQKRGVSNEIWIGLTTMMYLSPGQMGWTDFSGLTFNNLPDTVKEDIRGKLCGSMYVENSTWDAFDCEDEVDFVCTLPKLVPSSGTCDEGWKFFNGSCFKLTDLANRIEHSAVEATCTNEASKLASIHSRAENNFATGLTKSEKCRKAWIGALRSADGKFSWSDGSAWDYENWRGTSSADAISGYRKGFHASMNVREQLLRDVRRGSWLDTSDTYNHCVICKKPARKP